jgi:hypothetical protein
MVLPAPAPDDEQGLGGAAWLRDLIVALRIIPKGLILLVDGADDARLGELVRALAPRYPGVEVHTDALRVLNAPPGSLIVYAARENELGALNMQRPVFAQQALRVILWNRPGLSAAMVRRALDFYDWISDVVECPPLCPRFAVAGLRASLVARAPGVVWTGGPLDEVSRAAFPRRALHRADVSGGLLALIEALRAAGPGWIALTGAGTLDRVGFVETALGEAGRRSRVFLVGAARRPPGWWELHDTMLSVDAAIPRLAAARSPGRLAALVDLEPEAVDLCADLLARGADEDDLTRVLLAAADPGAALAALAVERGMVERDGVLHGAVASPPFLRAFAREIRQARGVRRPQRRRLKLESPRMLMSPTNKNAADEIRLLVSEARDLRDQGYPAEALRAAERAREGAWELDPLGLAIVATAEVARARAAVGDQGAALAAWAWIVAASKEKTIADAGARRAIDDAYAAIDALRAAHRVPSGRG